MSKKLHMGSLQYQSHWIPWNFIFQTTPLFPHRQVYKPKCLKKLQMKDKFFKVHERSELKDYVFKLHITACNLVRGSPLFSFLIPFLLSHPPVHYIFSPLSFILIAFELFFPSVFKFLLCYLSDYRFFSVIGNIKN